MCSRFLGHVNGHHASMIGLHRLAFAKDLLWVWSMGSSPASTPMKNATGNGRPPTGSAARSSAAAVAFPTSAPTGG